MPFLTPVKVNVPTREGDPWEVVEPLMYYSNVYRKPYIVPAGTRSDLASVPRLPLVFLLVGRRGDAAAILHDHLYGEGMRLKQIQSRKEADDVYYEALLDSEVNGGLAYMMFSAVRTAGAGHFTALVASLLLAFCAGCTPFISELSDSSGCMYSTGGPVPGMASGVVLVCRSGHAGAFVMYADKDGRSIVIMHDKAQAQP